MKAPGAIHVTTNVDAARMGRAGTVAFYAARMGTFYAEQLTRFGFGAEVARIKEAWASGGAKAATAAVPEKMLSELGYIGDARGARERLAAQHEAGIDIHTVEIDAGGNAAEYEKTVQQLLG